MPAHATNGNGTVANGKGTFTLTGGPAVGPYPVLQVVSSGPGTAAAVQNERTAVMTIPTFSAAPGGSSLLVSRLRIVMSDGQPAIGLVNFTWAYEYGGGSGGPTSGAFLLSDPRGEPASQTPTVPPCSLTSRASSLTVSKRAVTFRELTRAGVTASMQVCPGEYLGAALYTSETAFDANGDPRRGTGGFAGGHLGANAIFQPALQQGPASVQVRASGGNNLLYQLAGADRVRVRVTAWRSDVGDVEPGRETADQRTLIRLIGPPIPMGKPPLYPKKTADGVALRVLFPLLPRLAGRIAVIERRVGPGWVKVADARIGRKGLLDHTVQLRRDRAGGATGIAGDRTVQIRVRVLKQGGKPALGGTPNTARLP